MGASASRYTIAQQPSDDRGKSRRKKLSSKGGTKVASAASTDRKKRHSSSASSRPATGSTTRRLTIASSAGIVNRVAKSDSRNTGSRRTPVDDFNTERSDRVKARAGRQQGGGGGGSSSDRSRRQATNGVEHQASWSFGGHRLLLGGNDSRSNRTGTNSKTFHSAGTDPGGRPRRDRAASADTSLSKARPVSLPAGAHRSAMSTGGVPPKQERNWLGFRRNRGVFSGCWDVTNCSAVCAVCALRVFFFRCPICAGVLVGIMCWAWRPVEACWTHERVGGTHIRRQRNGL